MADNVTTKAYTLTQPEFAKFRRVAALGKPEFRDWTATEFNGWTTVVVPNWQGTRGQFFFATQP